MAKPPLFFIHGMWSRPRIWQDLRARYQAQGLATLAPALPYHDLPASAPPPRELGHVGIADYLAFLESEVRQLGSAPVVIGHSMGAMLAQLLATRVPVAGLVLLSPAPTASTGVFRVAPLRTVFGVTTKPGWWKKPIKLDREHALWGIFNAVPADVAHREIDDLVWDSGRVLFQMAMPWADPARGSRVDYSRLMVPTLIVVGDHDRLTPVATARATARRLPGTVDYRELPGIGHWLFHAPVVDMVAAEIDSYLARLPPADGSAAASSAGAAGFGPIDGG